MVVVEDAVERSGRPVLGDVFAPTDGLTVEARLLLAARLDLHGRAPAILPGQLGQLPLPADPADRADVRDTIEAGLSASALAALAGARLDAVVPLLRGRGDDVLVPFLPSPVRTRVAQHSPETTVAALTIGQISAWPGIGPRRAACVVAAAVEAAMELVDAGDAVPSVPHLTVDDLTTVLAFDVSHGGELRKRVGVLADTGPPEVRAAAERLLAVPASPAERCLAFLDDVLATVGDARDRGVFENGVLPLGPPVTRDQLADAVGVGPERVRQLGVRAVGRIDAAVDHAPMAVRQLAASVSELLGAAAPLAAVDDVLDLLDMPALPDTRSRLLLRMAGPYRAVSGHSGWVALDPAELCAETRRMIHEDGGVRLVEHVGKELHTLGMAAEHVGAWLDRQPVRVSDGLVVSTSGAPGDVAERALHARGRAMTMDELATWVPGGRGGADLLWSARDGRFVVTDDDALALAEWGDAADETRGPTGSGDDRPGTLRVEVDRALLGGAGAPVPTALIRALGVGRGSRRTFPTRYGPVTLSYDAEVPSRTSLRPVALAVGAAIGDELLITLYPDGRGAAVRLARCDRTDLAAT